MSGLPRSAIGCTYPAHHGARLPPLAATICERGGLDPDQSTTDRIADICHACDAAGMTDGEARFDERMRMIVKHKPLEKPEA